MIGHERAIIAFAFEAPATVLNHKRELSVRPQGVSGGLQFFAIRSSDQNYGPRPLSFWKKDARCELDSVAHRHHLLERLCRLNVGLRGSRSSLGRSADPRSERQD